MSLITDAVNVAIRKAVFIDWQYTRRKLHCTSGIMHRYGYVRMSNELGMCHYGNTLKALCHFYSHAVL